MAYFERLMFLLQSQISKARVWLILCIQCNFFNIDLMEETICTIDPKITSALLTQKTVIYSKK